MSAPPLPSVPASRSAASAGRSRNGEHPGTWVSMAETLTGRGHARNRSSPRVTYDTHGQRRVNTQSRQTLPATADVTKCLMRVMIDIQLAERLGQQRPGRVGEGDPDSVLPQVHAQQRTESGVEGQQRGGPPGTADRPGARPVMLL